MNSTPHVVIVGAGYAGVTAANRIRAGAHPDVTVTVVNPVPDFVERIRLHQYAAGSGTATVPLTDVLHPDVRLLVDGVDRIGDRSLTLVGGTVLDFDHLVYAVGSGPGGGVPGMEHAHTVASLDDADRLRGRLDATSPGAVVTVIGGGLTGVESAAEIAEQRPDLRVRLLSSGRVATGLSELGRKSVVRTLSRLGVEVDEDATVAAIERGAVVLANGTTAPTDVTVWAGPFAVPDLARRSGLPVDDLGRLRTDDTLAALGHPNVVGVGDAVAPPERVARHLRMSCQAAIPLGATGADTVLAQIAGAEPEPLSIGMVLQCISLGRHAGVVQVVRTDDSPRRLVLRGRIGAFVKERVCRSTVRWIGPRTGTYRWLSGPAVAPEGAEVSA